MMEGKKEGRKAQFRDMKNNGESPRWAEQECIPPNKKKKKEEEQY